MNDFGIEYAKKAVTQPSMKEIQIKQTEILEQQKKFTKILTLATAILAIATVYQLLLSVPITLILTYGKIPDPKSMSIFVSTGILLFLFLAVVLYFVLSYKKK